MNKIIAIVGMCGSGKSIASEYYENLGWPKVYFGGVTMDVMKEQFVKDFVKNMAWEPMPYYYCLK